MLPIKHLKKWLSVHPSPERDFIGTPIVAPDEQDKKKGEMSWNDIETMLSGFAYDAYYNQNETSKKTLYCIRLCYRSGICIR